ncbi:MAG: DUF393 domain-containing protein [Moraxellaceae bacterium]|nr:DUF393 domain-containing protein [Moraxellaceae bacterium]MDP1775166.1 DUF393 domain-containing protein [Moraxellaceae bacterium]MDZ4298917.1 DUF393 domain-containing protein [Moraxellaceae bacterium]MDZ4387666.1 DUF393 domain-containing protein [Moraxellaceae bacterium]
MQSLTLFYDGKCPICVAEVEFLQRRNQLGLLSFVDVNQPTFDDSEAGFSCAAAFDNIHASLADGRVLVGVPVFIEVYRRANLPVLVWLLSRPSLAALWAWSYRFFARNRHVISRLFGPPLLKLVRWRQAR